MTISDGAIAIDFGRDVAVAIDVGDGRAIGLLPFLGAVSKGVC